MSAPYPVVKTAPTFEPLSLDEAKDHLRVDGSSDDRMVYSYLKAARRSLEQKYNRAFCQQTLIQPLDTFGQPGWWPGVALQYAPSYIPSPQWGIIELRPPLQSIVTVTYLDPTGATQTLAASRYVVDTTSEPGRMSPSVGQIWPVTGPFPGSVKVEHISGAISADLIPDDQKEAIRLQLGHYFLNREDVITDTRVASIKIADGVDALMAPYAPNLVA